MNRSGCTKKNVKTYDHVLGHHPNTMKRNIQPQNQKQRTSKGSFPSDSFPSNETEDCLDQGWEPNDVGDLAKSIHFLF